MPSSSTAENEVKLGPIDLQADSEADVASETTGSMDVSSCSEAAPRSCSEDGRAVLECRSGAWVSRVCFDWERCDGSTAECRGSCDLAEKVGAIAGCEFYSISTEDIGDLPFDSRPSPLWDPLKVYRIGVTNPGREAVDVSLVRVLDGVTVHSEVVAPRSVADFTIVPSDDVEFTEQLIRITTTAPVLAFQRVPRNDPQFTTATTALLPTARYATEHRVLSRRQVHAIGTGFVTIVSPYKASVYVRRSSGVPGETYMLSAGGVLPLRTSGVGDDFTGMEVLSSSPVGLFVGVLARLPDGGIVCADGKCLGRPELPCATAEDCGFEVLTCCSDLIEEMALPVRDWGRTYVVPPVSRKGAKDTVRVIAARDSTLVTPFGSDAVLLNAGEWFELGVNENGLTLASSAPVGVAMYLGGAVADWGDPAMSWLRPVETASTRLASYYFPAMGGPPATGQAILSLAVARETSLRVGGKIVETRTLNGIGDATWVGGNLPIQPGMIDIESSGPVVGSVIMLGPFAATAHALE